MEADYSRSDVEEGNDLRALSTYLLLENGNKTYTIQETIILNNVVLIN